MEQHGDGPSARREAGLPSLPSAPGHAPMLRLPDGQIVRPEPGQTIWIPHSKGGAVDICFVFDTTGSMSDKIDGLVRCMVEFVDELAKLKLDWRITAVPFGDLTIPGDRVVDGLPFVTTRAQGERLLRTLPRFSGGGNEGESSIEAVLAALKKPYRKEAVTVLVVLTDEPPLQTAQLRFDTVARALRAREVICFVASPPLKGFRRWATENGGQWYRIGQVMDTSALLAFLRSLVKNVAHVARAVHEVGGGSVRQYLALEGRRPGELPPKR